MVESVAEKQAVVEQVSEAEVASVRSDLLQTPSTVAGESELTEERKGDGTNPEVIDLKDDGKVQVTSLVDWKVEHGRKCEVFNEWCRANGVVMPKLEYPAYFEGGLVGMRATAPIEHREAFLSIPYKMLMTVDAAQRHPVLGRIIADNPHLFSEEEKGDWE